MKVAHGKWVYLARKRQQLPQQPVLIILMLWAKHTGLLPMIHKVDTVAQTKKFHIFYRMF